MPLVPTEIVRVIEERMEYYWNSIISGGKFAEQETKIKTLEKTVVDLTSELTTIHQQLGSSSSAGVVALAPIVNSNELEAIKKELADLRKLFKNIKTGPDQFDLKKLFLWVSFTRIKAIQKKELKVLDLDYTSKEITGDILNALFKAQLKKDPNNPTGLMNYQFDISVINEVLSLKEWITKPTGNFKLKDKSGKMLTGYPKDNTFDTANPVEKQISLGTGTGKSTFFLRCLAHRHPEAVKGATLVVPTSALAEEILGNHNNWLSQDDPKTDDSKKDPRVIVCPICEERHTNYETALNGSSQMINVYTWWEFLDAYINRPEEIKPWVVFDEAHTDTPVYVSLINGLIVNKKRKFKIVQLSATFGNLPTSRKLSGTIVDYYVNNFEKIGKDVFKKTIIVFTDDVNKLNLSVLKDKGIKYLILNDSLKKYAKAIVQSLEPPLLVFANRDYSVGFSFGDVSVISTGVSTRTIVKNEKGEEEIIYGEKGSAFADLLQERGRGARDPNHSAVWMSLIPTNGDYKGKLKGDYFGETLDNYFKFPSEEKYQKAIAKIINLMRKPKPAPEMDPKEANLNLNRILVRALKEALDHIDIFKIKPSEKGKREAGEFIFVNKLMKHFDQAQLPQLLEEATNSKIYDFSIIHEWAKTEEEIDDFVFDNENEVKAVAFLLQAQKTYKVKEANTNKLVLKFEPFIFIKKDLLI